MGFEFLQYADRLLWWLASPSPSGFKDPSCVSEFGMLCFQTHSVAKDEFGELEVVRARLLADSHTKGRRLSSRQTSADVMLMSNSAEAPFLHCAAIQRLCCQGLSPGAESASAEAGPEVCEA